MFGLGTPEIILLLIVFLVLLLIPILALIDILRNEFTGNNKIVWLLVVIFFGFIGVILYYAIGQKQKIKN